MWRTDNIELIPDDGYYIMTLGELIDLGYINDGTDLNSDRKYDKDLTLGVGMNDVVIDTYDNLLVLNDYTRLDYIMSNGSQYIDLGYKAKINTEIRLNIQFVSNSNTKLANQNNNIIGRKSNLNHDASFTFNFGSGVGNANKIYYWVDKQYNYGATIYSKEYSSITSRSIFIVKSGMATFQGVSMEIANKTLDNTEDMIFLGSYNADLDGIASFNRYDAKVYSFQIYEGDKLVKNMIPCLKDGRAGLFDLVDNHFYLSDGSGDFLYGELE